MLKIVEDWNKDKLYHVNTVFSNDSQKYVLSGEGFNYDRALKSYQEHLSCGSENSLAGVAAIFDMKIIGVLGALGLGLFLHRYFGAKDKKRST